MVNDILYYSNRQIISKIVIKEPQVNLNVHSFQFNLERFKRNYQTKYLRQHLSESIQFKASKDSFTQIRNNFHLSMNKILNIRKETSKRN